MLRSRDWGCRLSHITVCGYRAVILENAALRVVVLADKGTDIVEVLYKPKDVNLLGQTPNALRERGEVSSSASKAGNFFDNYEGGWQEIFPSGGPPCVYRGAELGQHGEAALLPWSWQILEDEPERVSVQFSVNCLRLPLRLEKTLTLQGRHARLELHEKAINLSRGAVHLMWGHHAAYGFPLIEAGARLRLPRCQIVVPEEEVFADQRLSPGARGEWPQVDGRDHEAVDLSLIPGPDQRTADFCFLTDLEEARYRIESPRHDLTVTVEWEKAVMPCLWYWQVCGGVSGWPWWGRFYTQALEPFSAAAWGLDEAVRQNRALVLEGNSSRSFWLNLLVT